MANSPNYVFGLIYQFDNVANKFAVASTVPISPDQNMQLDYNYVRFVGGILGIQQSTQSTTNATLSGVCAAVRYEGFPSEIISEIYTPGRSYSQFYNGLLGVTNNQPDKIRNVRLSEGIKILSIPDQFNVDYIRTDDQAPVSGNQAVTSNSINSIDKSLEYDFTVSPAVDNATSIFNVDVPPNTQYSIEVSLNGVTEALTGSVTVDLCDINGDPIRETSVSLDYAFGAYARTSTQLQYNEYGFYLRVTNGVGFTGVTNGIDVTLKVMNGSMNSIIRPTTVIAYNGINVNTLLSVSGIRNYEVIPNPQTMRNVSVFNGYYDRDELDYVKGILSHKHDLKVKSTYSWVEYSNFIRTVPAFSNIDHENEAAHAAGIGDLLGGLKNIAKGVLNSVPIAGPLIGGLLDGLVPTSAGGVPMASGGMPARSYDYRPYSAGGLAFRRTHAADSDFDILSIDSDMSCLKEIQEEMVFHNEPNSERLTQFSITLTYNQDAKTVTIEKEGQVITHLVRSNHLHKQLLRFTNHANAMDTFQVFDDNGVFNDNLEDGKYTKPSDVVKIDVSNEPAVMFPTIIDCSMTCYVMYAVMMGFKHELINDPTIHTLTKDGYKVYNLHLSRPLSFATGADVTLVRLHAFHGQHNLAILKKTYVEGTSCLGAIYYLTHCQPSNGLSRAAITGSVMAKSKYSTDFKLMSNIYYYAKQRFCKIVGVPLIGVDFRMKSGMLQYSFATVKQEMEKMPALDDVTNFFWQNNTPAEFEPVKAFAADEESRPATLEELGTVVMTDPNVNIAVPAKIYDLKSLGKFKRTIPDKGVKTMQKIDYREKFEEGTMEIINKLKEDVSAEDVMEWLNKNNLINEFKILTRTDPDATKTKNVLQNLTRPMMAEGGLQATSIASTVARAQKVLQNLQGANAVPGVTVEWIVANNFRGPNAAQLKSFRAGNIPDLEMDIFNEPVEDKSGKVQANLIKQAEKSKSVHVTGQQKVLRQYPILFEPEMGFARLKLDEKIERGRSIDAKELSATMKMWKNEKIDDDELMEFLMSDRVVLPGAKNFASALHQPEPTTSKLTKEQRRQVNEEVERIMEAEKEEDDGEYTTTKTVKVPQQVKTKVKTFAKPVVKNIDNPLMRAILAARKSGNT
jgi:hypothetical protein